MEMGLFGDDSSTEDGSLVSDSESEYAPLWTVPMANKRPSSRLLFTLGALVTSCIVTVTFLMSAEYMMGKSIAPVSVVKRLDRLESVVETELSTKAWMERHQQLHDTASRRPSVKAGGKLKGTRSSLYTSEMESQQTSLVADSISIEMAPQRSEPHAHDVSPKILFYGYRSKEELDARSTRFPSPEERVKIYMSNWYVPPCQDNASGHIRYYHNETTKTMLVQELKDPPNKKALAYEMPENPRTFAIKGEVEMNRVIYVDREEHLAGYCKTKWRPVCNSTAATMYPSLDRLETERKPTDHPALALVQYGDQRRMHAYVEATGIPDNHPNLPVIKKYRPAFVDGVSEMTAGTCRKGPPQAFENVEGVTIFQPVVWKQKADRHFGMLDRIVRLDWKWKFKKNLAVFRGSVTGWRNGGLTNEQIETLPLPELCHNIPRCRLVLENLNSNLIDAKLVGDTEEVKTNLKGRDLTKALEGQLFTDEKMGYHDQLQYKAIIVPEGNDVATGLKWALFSESVVMIPPPTRTSFAMEELLQPWVHYVPLKPDMSDAEEKMQWIIDNDKQAQEIAHRGTLWIRDMVFHPEAMAEEQGIYDEILRRYQQHFLLVDNPSSVTAMLS